MDYLEKLTDYLEELDIKYFVTDILEGSDFQGYCCIYTNNDREVEDILLKLNFGKIKSDLFIIELSDIDTIDEKNIQYLKSSFAHRYKLENAKNELTNRKSKLEEIWSEIIEIFESINAYFLREHKRNLFEPTQETLLISLKLPTKLVKTDNDLKEFCLLLYQFAIESILKETLNFIADKIIHNNSNFESAKEQKQIVSDELLDNDSFYNDIKFLRNFYSHLSFNQEDMNRFNQCHKRLGIRSLKNGIDYFHFQLNLLKDFKEHLSSIDKNIKTKL